MKNTKPVSRLGLAASILVLMGCLNPITFIPPTNEEVPLPSPAGELTKDTSPFLLSVTIEDPSADPAEGSQTNRAVVGPTMNDIANSTDRIWNFVQVIAVESDTQNIADFAERRLTDASSSLSMSLWPGTYEFLTLIGYVEDGCLPTLLAVGALPQQVITGGTVLLLTAYPLEIDTKFTSLAKTVNGANEFTSYVNLLPVDWDVTWTIRGGGLTFLKYTTSSSFSFEGTGQVVITGEEESRDSKVTMNAANEVTLNLGDVTSGIQAIGREGTVAFNLKYVPFGMADSEEWGQFKTRSAVPWGDEGTSPVWIIRNGLNDTAHTGEGKWNGAIAFKVVADTPSGSGDSGGSSTLVIKDGVFEEINGGNLEATIAFTTSGYEGEAQVYYAAVSSGSGPPDGYSEYMALGNFAAGGYTGTTIKLQAANDDVYVIAVKDGMVSAPLFIINGKLDESLIIKDGGLSWKQPSLPQRKIRFTTEGYTGQANVYYTVVTAGAGAPENSAYTENLGAFGTGEHMEKEITLPGKEAYDVYMVIRQNGLWSAPLKIKIDTKFTGRFVGGDFDAIYWSSDGGETWIAGRGPNGTMLTLGDKNQDGVEDYLRVQDMAYGNGILVAVLGTPGNGLLPTVRSTVVLYSADGGETWNQASLPDNGAILNMVVYGAGKFVALPLLDSRYVYYSTNGKTWSRTLGMPSTMTNIRWKSLVFGNGMFVALPYCQENPNHYYINPDTYSMNITIIPYLAYSTNGTSWSAVSMPVTPATIGGTLAYADGGFLLNIEDEGYWSTDATNWQLQSTSKKPPSYLVSWKNIFARTIMSSGTTMQISKDKGISWEAATTPTNFGGYGAAYEKSSNGTEGRIILTWTSTYVWSDDSGVTWTQAESPPSLPLHGSTGPIIFRGFTYITP